MKLIKRLFRLIVILIFLVCAGVTVCAINPALTASLAGQVDKLELGDGTPRNTAYNGAEVTISGVPQIADAGGALSFDSDYIPPTQEVKAPAQVGNRVGYEPIEDSGQEIAEDAADALQQDLDTGNTGEGYFFDPGIYPYYAMLDEDLQALYRQIYANALEVATSFVPVVEVSVDQVKTTFEAVYNDHPELFWLETGYSCQYLQSGRCVEITLKYNRLVNALEASENQFNVAAERILSEARELTGEYEQEKYVHDALLATADYDTYAAMSQSAYSALVSGKSVCAGYSRAYQYLLQQLNIPCYYCTGYSGGDHAWNIVKLSDGYYNVDTTWDDTTPATYDYFNKSDADYASTHMRKGLSTRLPACLGEEYRNLEGDGPQIAAEDGVQEDDKDAAGEQEAVEPVYINENPQKPLTWEAQEEHKADDESSADEETSYALEDYYADCLAQMIAVGTGQKQFTNVIPQALWSSIEQEYSSGRYRTGYVDAALKQLGVENFAIQLQVERLGGGYYKLYHNISTW